MENKINIAEILKDCPKEMKLYSPIYGKVEFWKVNSNSVYSIMTATSIDRTGSFTSEGRLYEKYPLQNASSFPPVKCATGRSSSSEATWCITKMAECTLSLKVG